MNVVRRENLWGRGSEGVRTRGGTLFHNCFSADGGRERETRGIQGRRLGRYQEGDVGCKVARSKEGDWKKVERNKEKSSTTVFTFSQLTGGRLAAWYAACARRRGSGGGK